jgi:hypothetical protein
MHSQQFKFTYFYTCTVYDTQFYIIATCIQVHVKSGHLYSNSRCQFLPKIYSVIIEDVLTGLKPAINAAEILKVDIRKYGVNLNVFFSLPNYSVGTWERGVAKEEGRERGMGRG